jgi:hypothetical protein
VHIYIHTMFSRILRAIAVTAVCLATVNAHTVITYPGWRGDNLITNDTFPYGMQWMYPCKYSLAHYSLAAVQPQKTKESEESSRSCLADFSCRKSSYQRLFCHRQLLLASQSLLFPAPYSKNPRTDLLTLLQVAVCLLQRTAPSGP